MPNLIELMRRTQAALDLAGGYLAPLGLRLLLAWEFWEGGVEKLHGENWFAHIRDDFPFPFNLLPLGLSWFLATWTELLGSAALAAGLATRLWAFALAMLDVVAWASVHAGNGYNVCDNGYKLPLIFLVMLVPLILSGGGKASLDHLLARLAAR